MFSRRDSARLARWDRARTLARRRRARKPALARVRFAGLLGLLAGAPLVFALAAAGAGPAAGQAVALLGAVLLALYALFQLQPDLLERPRGLPGVLLATVAAAGGAAGLASSPWGAVGAHAVPLIALPLVLRWVVAAPAALGLGLLAAKLAALASGGGLPDFGVSAAGVVVATLAVRRRHRGGTPAAAGAIAGAASGLFAAALAVGAPAGAVGAAEAWGRYLLLGALAGGVVAGLRPFADLAGVMTPERWRELADPSHPLWRELSARAPGTAAHSRSVAVLAEAAAEAIGLDALPVRVGALFHDVGKMVKPEYFIENCSGPSPHGAIEPSLSTLVILGHVKDGVELARRHKLPRLLVEWIQEHHGTTLVEYFYREALKIHGAETAPALESTFRYPGPKPRSREAAILMIADAAESAARCLPSPGPAALRRLVAELARRRRDDGQFDECEATCGELRAAEEAIGRALVALHHGRISYAA